MGGLTIMVYLVRQGETDWNLLKKFNGCTDIELNQTGIEQAQYQAENLKKMLILMYAFEVHKKEQFKLAKSSTKERVFLMIGLQ